MEKEESTRIPDCKSKVAKYLSKMGYYTTVPFHFATKEEPLMSNANEFFYRFWIDTTNQ